VLSFHAFSQNSGNAVDISLEFLSNMEKGNFEANKKFMAALHGNDEFSAKLSKSWNFQVEEHGAFKNLKSTKYDYFREYEIVYLTCEFEQSDYTVKLVFNKRQEITDIYFIPYPPLIPAGQLTSLWVIMFFILWELAWKAMGLWKAGRNQKPVWFLVIFLIPTFGLLPIFYTLFVKE
jgi:hypothetical protein